MGPKVLLTGANGFLASAILKQLVEQNFSVTGTVRSPSKAAQIHAQNPTYAANLTLITVPDISAAGAWDAVFQSTAFDYVIHTASKVPEADDTDETTIDFDAEYLRPAEQGTLELLTAVEKYGKSVKHISFTGSLVNSLAWPPMSNEGAVKRELWNPLTVEKAREAKGEIAIAIYYWVAKKYAELAIWDFMKTRKPHFTVTVLNLSSVFGPAYQPLSSLKDLNISLTWIYDLFTGDINKQLTNSGPPVFADVRDCAAAHIAAFDLTEAHNKRFLFGSAPYSNSEIAEIIGRRFPELKGRIIKNLGKPKTLVLDDRETVEAFGKPYRFALEESVVDTVKQLLVLEEREKQ